MFPVARTQKEKTGRKNKKRKNRKDTCNVQEENSSSAHENQFLYCHSHCDLGTSDSSIRRGKFGNLLSSWVLPYRPAVLHLLVMRAALPLLLLEIAGRNKLLHPILFAKSAERMGLSKEKIVTDQQ